MAEQLEPALAGVMPTRVGKYKILRQIAQGGMAEIYLATAVGIEGFEKLCVLKRILPQLASNSEFVEMFLDEARIAGSLLHSNIAQVFDIGSDGGNYYFVMEFLRGEDVRHVLMKSVERREVIPYEHIVSMITGVCAGLHYAHEMRGRDGKELHIVHRDISPQNVFVTHDGSVKLFDFGIAKSATQLTETRVGTLKGKIRYMAPEQCLAEPLDRRSDVFALSIVLWELITQRRLYRGKSDFEIFKAIVDEDAPPVSNYRRDVHPALEAVVMKGLKRKREERYQTAQELQIALEDWARSERVPASPVRLAGYMKELFGDPPPIEAILESNPESDAVPKRIGGMGLTEDSGRSGSLANRARPAPDLQAMVADLARNNGEGAEDLLETSARIDGSQLTGSLRPPSRAGRIFFVIAALVAASLALMFWLGHKPPPVVAPVEKPSNEPVATTQPTAPDTTTSPPPTVPVPTELDDNTHGQIPKPHPATTASTSNPSAKKKPKKPTTGTKGKLDEMFPPEQM